MGNVVEEQSTRWVMEPEPEVLRFTLAGRELKAVPLCAVTLSTPFTKLTTNLTASEPPWDTIPAGIDAAVLPEQPVEVDSPRLMFLPNSIRYVAACSERYFVDLQGSFAEYLNKLSQNSRHNLRRRVRRFTEFSGGRIRWATFCLVEELSEFYRLATEISKRSWNEAEGGPGFSGTFKKDRIESVSRQDRSRGYVLFDRERPIAFAYCEIHEKDVDYLKIGYDQDYSEWSPGTVLFYLLLQSLFAEGKYGLFDFKDGVMWYKSTLATGSARCARIIYFRRNFRNLAIVTAHASLASCSRGAGMALRVVNLKERIKGLMMGKLRRPGQ